jgi:hypothetical protein
LNALAQLPRGIRSALAVAAAIFIYLAAGYIMVGRGLLGDFSGRIVSAGTGRDPSVMIWCLAWFPHAIANHLDPFLTRAVWWPVGINLAWITSIPGAAILAWPMTRELGPIASFNALSFIALPAAAFSAFLLCRHLTGRNLASIVGGYVFGFSPYFLGQLQNHLVLILAFPIPLAVLLTVRLLEGAVRPRVFAPLMALLLAVQLGFSLEMFATSTSVGIFALLIGFAIGPEHWRTAIRGVAAPLAASFAIAALLAAPYCYYLFAFGMHKGSINSPSAVSIDLLNFLIPTEANLLGANAIFARFSSRFGFRPEAGGWVPWPLLASAALYIRARWRKPVGKVLTVMLALLAIAALGPRLHVDGHVLIGLPWKVVEHIPLVGSAMPGRLMMYGFLILGVMTARVLTAAELPNPAKFALAIAIPVFMLPNLDYQFWTTAVDLPVFFAQGTYAHFLQKDETVLILPYANRGNSMIWQADADFYFRMAGGYTGAVIIDEFQKWPIVNAIYNGTDLADGTPQLGAFLAAHDVRDVVVQEKHAAEYLPVLAILHALSLPATHVGEVIVFPIAPEKIAKYRDLTPLELERRYDRDRFERLLVAASKYLAQRETLSQLTPARAKAIGLLPPTWAVDEDVYTRDGLILGPWQNDQVQVGVVGSYEALQPLIADYRADAAEVYFPFPRPLVGPPKGNALMRKLVLVFDRLGFERAAKRAASELAADETPLNAQGSRR